MQQFQDLIRMQNIQMGRAFIFNTQYNMYQHFENSSLLQILNAQNTPENSHRNLYVLALSKSRYEPLTQSILTLIYQLYSREGNKWLQILNRSLANYFMEGYQPCLKTFHFYRPVLNLVFQKGTNEQLVEMISLIEKMMLQMGQEKGRERGVKVESICVLMQKIIINERWDIANSLIEFLCRNPQILQACSIRIRATLNQVNKNEEQLQQQKQQLQFIKLIASLQVRLEEKAIRHLCFLKLSQATILIQQHLAKLLHATLIPLLPIKIQEYIFSKNSGTHSNSQINFLYDLCVSLINSISYICTSSCLWGKLHQFFGSKNEPVVERLIDFFIRVDIVELNRSPDFQKQFIQLSYELVSRKFSDTLAGQLSRLIAIICENYGEFLINFVKKLISAFQQQVSQANSNKSYIPFYILLMKLSIPSMTLKQHQQALNSVLNCIFTECFSNFSTGQFNVPISELDKLEILMFMMTYSQYVNEKMICFSFKMCINNMKSIYFQEISNGQSVESIEDNFWYSHSYDLLVVMTEKENVCQVLHKNLGEITEEVLNLPLIPPQNCGMREVPLKFYKIYLRFIEKFSQIISRSSYQILSQLYRAFEFEIVRVWGNNKKNSPQIGVILQILGIIIKDESEEEFSFEEVTEYIVPILSYLENPFKIQFQDELIEILAQLIRKHKFFSIEIAIIIGKLKGAIDKNEGKLSIINEIYEALSSNEKIIDQVCYQSKEVIEILLYSFLNYLHHFQLEQYLFYKIPVMQLFDALQIFISAYQVIIKQSFMNFIFDIFAQLKNIILKLNDDTSLGQIRNELKQILVQTSMSICHILPVKQILQDMYKIIKLIPITDFTSIHVIGLIPICLTDYLLHEPEEYEIIIPEIIEFYSRVKDVLKFYNQTQTYPRKFYEQYDNEMKLEVSCSKKKLNKILKERIWPKRAREYIENGLRELRGKKLIDQMAHLQALQSLSRIFL